MGRDWQARSRSSPARHRASARRRVELFRSEGATVVGADVGDGADVRADAGSEGDVRDLVDQVVRQHGGLDIFFANAGISGGFASIAEQTAEDWAEILRVNLIGPFLAIKYAAPADASARRRVDHLHGKRRRASLRRRRRGLFGVEGRRDQPRPDGRPAALRHRHPRQRHLPRPDRDRHDQADLRHGARPAARRTASASSTRCSAAASRSRSPRPRLFLASDEVQLRQRPGAGRRRRPVEQPPDRPPLRHPDAGRSFLTTDYRLREPLVFVAIAAVSVGVFLPAMFGAPRLNESFWIDWVWLDQFVRELAHGNLYPRWLPLSHHGLGSPVFYYYPPLGFYLGSLFVFAGLSTYAAIVATFIVASMLSGVGVYFWSKGQSQTPLVGTLVFVIAPYHVFDFYFRGALAPRSSRYSVHDRWRAPFDIRALRVNRDRRNRPQTTQTELIAHKLGELAEVDIAARDDADDRPLGRLSAAPRRATTRLRLRQSSATSRRSAASRRASGRA